MPRGGRRSGAGRPRKPDAERALDGGATHRERGRVLVHPNAATGASEPATAALPVLDESDAPNELSTDERVVWLRLAPHAMQKGRLTEATAFHFVQMCKNIALMHRYAASVTEAGGASHRGLIQRVDTELLTYGLVPSGARDANPQKVAVDPMQAKYFG